ncbi:DUF1194 domain-containing protein [Aurantimonas marina]|uniref:DUF1194 domain-containing protein n=1 Tax=Aurantimonas marina TaxID=2780508 RepID=UPI0019D1B762|nr:DUF1194 domain-containing protein [Aurantimonas marina]
MSSRVAAFAIAFLLHAGAAGLLGLVPAQAQQRGLGDLGTQAEPVPQDGQKVDVELVLAVDVSWSMDHGEQEIQREGYVAAFRSPAVQRAILEGGYGRVAVTYIEWAGMFSQSVIVPWTLIDSKASAEAFAYRLASEEPERQRRTSIASAIDFIVPMFDRNGFDGRRRVVDISGDGPNNQGRVVTAARDAAVARGITINGLPLMTSGGGFGWSSIPDLDRYYTDCVIGGPSAFIIPVNDWSQFPEAVRRKLVLELAGTWPDLREAASATVIQTQNAAAADCLIGERLWQQRQRRWLEDFQ